MSLENVYDLWPLAWWQNPYIVAGCVGVAVGIMGVIALYVVWRRRNKSVSFTAREKLLLRLNILMRYPYHHEQERNHAYDELMCIIREFAAVYYGVSSHCLTDEEFIISLTDHHARDIPIDFIELAEQVCDEACLSKFAVACVESDVLRERLQQVICYVQGSIQTNASSVTPSGT